mmetsp:Transcript_671/g.1417  ORF Transcript_671/g.1417 Transcript_671/m.1417 type:complete len:86 (-) Transcript_671:78-335(-)
MTGSCSTAASELSKRARLAEMLAMMKDVKGFGILARSWLESASPELVRKQRLLAERGKMLLLHTCARKAPWECYSACKATRCAHH